MRQGDFGAEEVLFLLCLTLVGVLLSWFLAWAYMAIVQAITGTMLFIAFMIYGFFH